MKKEFNKSVEFDFKYYKQKRGEVLIRACDVLLVGLGIKDLENFDGKGLEFSITLKRKKK